MTSHTLSDRLSLALLSGAGLVTAALYRRLPDPMPVHFDLHGRADGWMPRAFAAPMLPLIGAGVWAFVRYGARLLPPPARERYERSPIGVAAMLTAGFMAGLQLCVLAASLGDGTFGRGFSLLLAVFWLVMGLLFPKVRRNPFLGVRVSWALRSDEDWARTHRLAGQCFTVGGLVALVGAAFGSVALAISAALVSALASVVGSWWLARHVR
jgi:uncharacterized membrane protein